MGKAGGIWALGELDEQRKLSRSSVGLLLLGRKLADASSRTLCTVFLGEDVKDAAEQSLSLGSDKALVIEDVSFAEYEPDLFVHAFEDICKALQPDIFLAGHTALGQDFLPRLAARLDAPIVTDCIDLQLEQKTGKFLLTKPVYGGNAVAVFSAAGPPQLATVRTKLAISPPSHSPKNGELVQYNPIPFHIPSRTLRIQKIKDHLEGVRIEDSGVVVSGGRGIGNAEGFMHLGELAELLHGAVGASRPACDMGWISPNLQIGLTGRTVAPKVYFAVAISGMMQHITGMFESQCVIAINKDKDANIFKMADYGVVGDYREILPALIGKLKQLT